MSFKHLFATVSVGLVVHSAHAVVVPPLPPGMVGSFEGLLRVGGDAGGAPSGKVELAVLATGKFAGKLTLTDDVKVYPLTMQSPAKAGLCLFMAKWRMIEESD